MELPEVLNERLLKHYGHKYDERAEFRVVWSEDQFEVRFGEYDKYSASGIWTGREVGFKQVPKYRQYLPTQWVLERLTPVPEASQAELVVKLSYEPLFGFRERYPQWEELKLIVDTVLEKENAPRVKHAKYKDDDINLNTKEATEARVDLLKKELFSDDDSVRDALHYKEAVTVPAQINTKETES